MTEEKEQHEIDRIAKAFKTEVWTFCSEEGKWASDFLDFPPDLLFTKDHKTKTEAKDALLAKLRAIVCPDYDKTCNDYNQLRESTDKLVNERNELASLVYTAEQRGYQRALEDLEKEARDDDMPACQPSAWEKVEYYINNLKREEDILAVLEV